MKLMIALFLFAMFGLALTNTVPNPYPRGCIFVNKKCYRGCEEGTHAYITGCGHLTPEATCDNPNPVTDTRAALCDFSACYCDPPTVRDTAADKCVPLEECPKKENKEKEN